MSKVIFLRSRVFCVLLLAGPMVSEGGCKSSDSPAAPDPVVSSWQSGEVFYDQKHWTECDVGNMPLIITVPHGGSMEPANVPDRSCPDITTVTDSYTIELAHEISTVLEQKYHVHPYLVICHLKRTKIDQNRDVMEGTCGNAIMTTAWNQFHEYADTALTDIVKQFGSALYIDLHGHGHTKQRLELGYSLDVNALGNVLTRTHLAELWHQSSLNNLSKIDDGVGFRQFVIGDDAFGTMMEQHGFQAVPSKDQPYPQSSDPFFEGGYNTRLYTGPGYPHVFGWQIESNYQGVRDTKGRPLFAQAFAEVIVQYMQYTMNYKP